MAKWGEIKCREADSKCPRCAEMEAKLAKAVEALGTALDEMVDYADTHPAWSEIWEAREVARTTLAAVAEPHKLTSSEAATKEGGKDE